MKQQGTIVKIKESYGFIRVNESEANVFFHSSQCEHFSELEEGNVVQFETEETQKGTQAKGVKKIS